MPKTYNQKLKLMYLLRFLMEETDEAHPASMKEIIRYLDTKEIHAERKSIYSDIDALFDFGVDIIRVPGKDGGYYIGEREFELPELKLLVDAVQSSKFITRKKSGELIKKLEKLVSSHEAKQLNRQVVVRERNKAANENIYYNIDMIYNGIAANSMIRFLYYEWTVEKEMKPRRNREFYQVSPWFLNWDDENYYLIAYDSEKDLVKHFRVDKMAEISLMEEPRRGKERMENLNLAVYTKKTFGMFAGNEETVSLDVENALIGVFIDRFGQDISVRKIDLEHFRARVQVAVSPQFFGWLAGLGNRVKVVLPEHVAAEYLAHLKEIAEAYRQ